MERTLLNVAPADSGWNVSVKGLLLDQKPTRGAALDSANSHAFKRYVVTGLPTGVSLVMDGGETVLVSING